MTEQPLILLPYNIKEGLRRRRSSTPGLEFAIHRGETVTILGTSPGAARCVMLKMLIGLIEADSGEILFDGSDVTQMDRARALRCAASCRLSVSGAQPLFDSARSSGENVAYGLREQNWNTMSDEEISRRVAHSLESVGLPGIKRCARAISRAA